MTTLSHCAKILHFDTYDTADVRIDAKDRPVFGVIHR